MAKPLPILKLDDLFPDSNHVSLSIQGYVYKLGNMPLPEMGQLCRLVKCLRPKVIFEIGTFEGNTTLQLALNSDAEVYTLDLPPEQPRTVADPDLDVYPGQLGLCFRDTCGGSKIHQLLGDSQTFDFTPWHGKVDLVFVDGCHHYDFVRLDTQHALKMLAPEGVILWHDYAPWAPGVMRALEELAESLPLVQIADTNLVFYCRDEQRIRRKLSGGTDETVSNALKQLQARYEELRARYEEVEASRSILIEGNKQLQASLTDWQGRYHELQTSCNSTEAICATLRVSNQEFETSLADWQARSQQLRAECEELEASRAALATGNKELEGSLADWQARYQQLQAKFQELEASQAALSAGNTDLAASLADWQARHQQLQSSHQEVEASRDALIEGNKQLEASLLDWQARYQEAQTTCQELEASRLALIEGNKQLEASLTEWQAHYEELESNYNALRSGGPPRTRRVF